MFWIGLIVGAGAGVLAMWLVQKNLGIKWYEWLMGGLTVILLILAVQHYIGSLNEYEPTAGWMGALMYGGVAIILGAVAFQLVWRRHRAA